jgi:hypothetical protein
MKNVREIRDAISSIPKVFFNFQPEESGRGDVGAVKTIWSPNESWETDERIAPMDEGNQDEPGGIPEIEDLFEFGAEIDREALTAALGGRSWRRNQKKY